MPPRFTLDTSALFDAVRSKMSSRALSYRDVGDEIGVSPPVLIRLGQGQTPRLNSVLSICAWLRTDVNDFVRDDDNRDVQVAVSQESVMAPETVDALATLADSGEPTA